MTFDNQVFFTVTATFIDDEGYDEYGAYYGVGAHVYHLDVSTGNNSDNNKVLDWYCDSIDAVRAATMFEARQHFAKELAGLPRYYREHTGS